MRLKTQRKVVYVAMGLTVLALTGGFALANLSLGSTNTVQQGSQTTAITPIPGLTWQSTTLTLLNSNVVNRSCPSPTGCSVQSIPAFDCAGGVSNALGCQGGNWVEQVDLSTVADQPFPAPACITLYATVSGTTYTGITYCYTDSTGNPAQPITQDFGVGNISDGPQNVTVVSVVAVVA